MPHTTEITERMSTDGYENCSEGMQLFFRLVMASLYKGLSKL